MHRCVKLPATTVGLSLGPAFPILHEYVQLSAASLEPSYRLKFRMPTSPPRLLTRGVEKWESLCSNWVRHCYIYRNLWCPVVARYLSCLLPPYRHRISVADGESEDGDSSAEDAGHVPPGE